MEIYFISRKISNAAKQIACGALFPLVVLLVSCSHPIHEKDTGPRRIEILFLGNEATHHNSAEVMPMMSAALGKEGINFTYTDDLKDLRPEILNMYDGLMLYANYDEIEPEQEFALLQYVKGGKGFLPIHCASYCFRNSNEFVDMVGAQFLRHDVDTFKAEIIMPDHPAIRGVEEFTTWDETYVHHKHSDDRIILMERVDGEVREPWTWVKNYGHGRVFYTAYGHDERTWNNSGFHALIKQGILWAVGDEVKEQWEAFHSEIPQLVYKDIPNIPNYEKRDPVPQYQEPLTPEEEMKLIQVPVGFHLELFAAEPDIINPIAMDWDEKGRLWVIETVDYPNSVRNEPGIGDDRIKICEDTDGDGKADKFTVFIDDLNIPTSMAFVNGGIIVSQAPDFLFLKDTDGDDKADVRQTLISGWGTFDTHAGPSNLKYGINNQIWGVVGYSGFSGAIGGNPQKFGQGIYHFNRDLSGFEYLTRTTNNTWGLGFTEGNEVFASTANNTHSVHLVLPEKFITGVKGMRPIGNEIIDGHYAMHPITDKVRQVDVWGGFTAASGHNFYTARAYPNQYWNKVAFVCEPTGHLIHMAKITPDGAGYEEKDGWNLFAGADEWTSPVEAKVGPDGMVWVADWYNFIIQHNPTPSPDRGGYQAENGDGNAYENPLRDKSHGRIWRVVYDHAPSAQAIHSLNQKNTDELLSALGNQNMFWRMTAQRLLVERNQLDILPELCRLVKFSRLDESGENFGAMHALWTMHGLGALNGEDRQAYGITVGALIHGSPAVRKAAIEVLPSTVWAKEALMSSKVYLDSNPQVQLAAILKIAEMPTSPNTGKLLYNLFKDKNTSQDDWISRAIYATAVRHREGFIAAYLTDHPNYLDERNKKEDRDQLSSLVYDDSHWKTIILPGYMGDQGVEADGEIWLRKEINILDRNFLNGGRINLGYIDDSDETFINGLKVGGMMDSKDIRRSYSFKEGILKPGKNIIAIKMTDLGGRAGVNSNSIDISFREGTIDLSGEWKYKVMNSPERIGNQMVPRIADTFMENYYSDSFDKGSSNLNNEGGNVRQINISVVKNEMKYDITSFNVVAGETVEIVFSNPDFMQHNLLIIQPGQLERVGKAADALATTPDGAEKSYIPSIPQVLFSTSLVDPNSSIKLRFKVPTSPGKYPFLCTFPGHWRIMNGVMNVIGPSL